MGFNSGFKGLNRYSRFFQNPCKCLSDCITSYLWS